MLEVSTIKALGGLDFSFQPSLDHSRILSGPVVDGNAVIHFLGLPRNREEPSCHSAGRGGGKSRKGVAGCGRSTTSQFNANFGTKDCRIPQRQAEQETSASIIAIFNMALRRSYLLKRFAAIH